MLCNNFVSTPSVAAAAVARENFSKGTLRRAHLVKLTFRATRTEPACVAVTVLGRRGRATIVDAHALNTAVRVVQALFLKLALGAVIETVASALAQEITPVTATVLPIGAPLEDLSTRRR